MNKTFGQFLSERRRANNLTQHALAEQLFVSASAVSKWEKDIARPDISLLPKLSQLLGVSEHELITASIDLTTRTEKTQAKRWRALAFTWRMFFLLGYSIALLTCFICNLAVSKRLDWFWVVAASLLLAATFTNIPRHIKKYRLLLIPLSQFAALCLLLFTCGLYTGDGSWVFVTTISILFGLLVIFFPIYLGKYKIFSKIKKFADFISLGADFIMLNILLIVCDTYSVSKGYSNSHWYLHTALPLVFGIYLILNLFLLVRFLKTNRFVKTGVILSLANFFLYVVPRFIKVKIPALQKEIHQANPFNADFSNWKANGALEPNVHCIIALTLLFLAIVFLAVGFIRALKKKKSA